MKKPKKEKEPVVISENNDIISWSYKTIRSKTEICEESRQLLKNINKNSSNDLGFVTNMINLHNEYRFPLFQLVDTTQKNFDVANQFLTFLVKIKN